MAVIGNLLAFINIVVIAFGIHHLTLSPDPQVAAWVVALTWLVSRRIDETRPGMLPPARAL